MPINRAILVPVDFSVNTNVAVKKALELSDDGTIIHLLHVEGSDQQAEKKLEQWKFSITDTIPGVHACTWLCHHPSIQKQIEKLAKTIQADLIVIGKKVNHAWFPFLNTVVPSQVAQHTGTAVLTVKPGSLHNKIRTMVVPVTGGPANYQMDVITTLTRKFKIRIHLVTFMDNNNKPVDFYASSLLHMYDRIKKNLRCPVEYGVLHGQNKGRALLKYAEGVNADLVLVHSETTIKFPKASRMQVLYMKKKIAILEKVAAVPYLIS